MIKLRPFQELGEAHHGWLHARHHFSFASYYHPDFCGWGSLKVWNDDEIAPHSGFPKHPHSNMEIITYVREGEITHQDSLGNEGKTAAGDVQVMSAGSGIFHSEFNNGSEKVLLFQIWIESSESGGAPYWGTKKFPKNDRTGRFVTLASGYAEDKESLPIRSQARLLGATASKGEVLTLSPSFDRYLYCVLAKGRVRANDVIMRARDGLAIHGETTINFMIEEDAELLVVET